MYNHDEKYTIEEINARREKLESQLKKIREQQELAIVERDNYIRHMKEEKGESELHIAVRGIPRICITKIDELHKLGHDLNVQDFEGNTPLHKAVKNIITRNDNRIVSLLVGLGADHTIKNNNGETALDLAKRLGHNNQIEAINDHIEAYNQYLNEKKSQNVEQKNTEQHKEGSFAEKYGRSDFGRK